MAVLARFAVLPLSPTWPFLGPGTQGRPAWPEVGHTSASPLNNVCSVSEEHVFGRMLDRRDGIRRPDRCPNCHRDTSLARLERRTIWPEVSENLVLPDGACVVEDLWLCDFCHHTILELRIFSADHDHGSDVEPDDVILAWPQRAPRELSDAVPADVASFFMEASKAEFAGALRGAGALYRATIECVCDDLGATGKDLYHRIEDLARLGIDSDLISAFHEARTLGNWTLHEGIEFSREEVSDIAELIADAAYIFYDEPERRRAMSASRRSKRDAGLRSHSDGT